MSWVAGVAVKFTGSDLVIDSPPLNKCCLLELIQQGKLCEPKHIHASFALRHSEKKTFKEQFLTDILILQLCLRYVNKIGKAIRLPINLKIWMFFFAFD